MFLKILLFERAHSLFKLILRQLKCKKYLNIPKNTILWFSINYKFGAKRYSSCSRAVFMKRFYFYLLKTDYYWDFNPFFNKQKPKEKFSDNVGQNICRLFNFLAEFAFTTSKTELDYYH